MTLYTLIDTLKRLALTIPNVRSTSEGDIYRTLNNNPSIQYDVVHIMQNTHQHLEYLDRYNLTIFFVSRLDDTLEDNRLQCQSVGKEVLKTLITDFCNMYELDFPTYTVQVFTEKFVDLCAGCFVNLTFEIPADACADDYSEIVSVYQSKEITIIENGEYYITADSGFTALKDVTITVEVPTSGSGDYQQGYDDGYEDGYNDGLVDCGKDYDEGYEDGTNDQKAKLSAITITVNGNYNRNDGYSAVTVNVPQTGYTQDDLNNYYNSGYTSGITYQKSLLSAITITENGNYNRENGYSAVTVNIAQTGYTQADLDNAYDSGYTSGWTDGYESGYTNGLNYCCDYLTIEALSGGTLYWYSESKMNNSTIKYSKNGGEWTNVTSSNNGSGTTIETVESGDIIRFKGDNNNYANYQFKTDFKYIVYGNIMSLINSTSFKTLKTLPSTYTFQDLFKENTGLISAENLILPATALTYYCYEAMFAYCTNLITAPLTIGTVGTTMAEYCFGAMFRGCTSLINPPALPATNLTGGDNCYHMMFYDCSGLTIAPALPATVLSDNCYDRMFEGCTNLKSAPILPATTLTRGCYVDMFAGCTNLTMVQTILPATTLQSGCYQHMFKDCTSITNAPILPAPTLVQGCYYEMFRGCTNLNYIKCLATDISATNCITAWVTGVQTNSGIFIKDNSMTGWEIGDSGIPSNWTIQNAN